MSAPELPLADVIELAAARQLSLFLGAARGHPAVIVDLGGGVGREAGEHIGGDIGSGIVSGIVSGVGVDDELATLPAVLIGVDGAGGGNAGEEGSAVRDVPRLAGARRLEDRLVDVIVDDLDSARALAEQVAARPLAATSLALLLRHGERRTVPAGLVAESTTYSMLLASGELREWRRANPAHGIDVAGTTAPTVRVERDGATTHIVLDRPRRHNALDASTSELLVAALTEALSEPDVRVVLRGDGPSFCSGGDLDEFGSYGDAAAAHTVRLSRSAGHLVHLLRDRLEVRLHGACIGAGIEVPAFAGRLLATTDARIALPEVAFGLVPGAGGTVSVPRRIGRHRTMWLALTGTTLDASTALAWGLVDEVTTAV